MKRLLLLCCCLAAACGQARQAQQQPPQAPQTPQTPQTPQAPQRTQQVPSELLTQLRSLDRSCNTDAQCRTVPLGAKPCGGPEAYLPYSTSRNQEASVRDLAGRYSKERAAEHQRRGMAGDCMMVPDPGAVCRAGTCELGGSGKDK
jgi:hypothetical protein